MRNQNMTTSNKAPKVYCEMIFTFRDTEQMMGEEDLDLSSERSARRDIRAFLRKEKIKGELLGVSMCAATTEEDLKKNYTWYWSRNGKLPFGWS
jgi:hypothetical protein